MSEKIRTEFIEKLREKTGKKDKKEMSKEKGPGEEKSELKDKIKREIDYHLKYLWEKIENESAFRSGRVASVDEIKKIDKEQKSNEELIKSAEKQLKIENAGEEILRSVSDEFPTQEEKEASDKLHFTKTLLTRQGLDPDILPPDPPSKLMIDSYKKQIEFEQNKRRGWAEYIEREWGKKK